MGILVSILSQVLKHSGREEQAFLASLAGLILVLSWILPYIYDLFLSIRQLFALWRGRSVRDVRIRDTEMRKVAE